MSFIMKILYLTVNTLILYLQMKYRHCFLLAIARNTVGALLLAWTAQQVYRRLRVG